MSSILYKCERRVILESGAKHNGFILDYWAIVQEYWRKIGIQSEANGLLDHPSHFPPLPPGERGLSHHKISIIMAHSI